jgi:hypothetical protein
VLGLRPARAANCRQSGKLGHRPPPSESPLTRHYHRYRAQANQSGAVCA